MKKEISAIAAAVVAASCLTFAPAVPKESHAENPIVQTSFTPDPAPVVFGDELYVFTGCDRDGDNDFYKMTGWQCFSTKDMKNWTDHGRILEDTSFSWCGQNDAWASQCIERNGKYYFYFTTTNKAGGGRAIGVAVADSPEGPYKDVLGKPLCGPNWNYIDPTVMIDDDGQAWLMFGNPTCYYVKLKDDMVTLDGQIKEFSMTEQAFGPNSDPKRASAYGEGPWIYKHGGLYYLVYAAFVGSDTGESMAYATGPSVTGPWTYRGQIQKGSNCYTIHGGIVDYKDHSYYFYHMNGIPGGGVFNRSAACEEFTYNSDGTIPSIPSTKSGPDQIEALDPFQKVEAETICWSQGIKTEKCSAGGVNIANIEDGDYVKVSGVDFGDGADTFTASVASATDGGTIELHINDVKGPVIGTCKVGSTGGWQDWQEVTSNVLVDGVHDLYFVFRGESGYLLNVDWWKFDGAGSAGSQQTDPDPEEYIFHNTFERGAESWTGRGAAEVALNSDNAFAGKKSLYVSGRTASWNGVTKQLGSQFKAGEEYSFSVNAMYNEGNNDVEKFYLTMQYDDANGDPHYDKIARANPMKGEWVQLANNSFKIPEGAENIHIYVETENTKTSFYIDEAVVAKAGTEIEGANGKQLIRGDINFDGTIDSFDVLLSKRGIVKGFKDSSVEIAADVDKSGKFELNDVVLLQQYILGKIKGFPDNTPEPEPDPATKSNFTYNSALQFSEAPSGYLDPCSQAGKIVKETYNGINGTNSLNVYLPYGYDSSKKYNIFYLMHGGGENENTIFSNDVKLNNILDHMIMNGELEPLIVVTPTFNKCEAGTFYNEFRQSVVPFVEGKYSTYAESTTDAGLKASRSHRAYGGFSMGSLSAWCVADHCLDIVQYIMPLSGDNWEGINTLTKEINSLGLKTNEYFIFCATGSDDLAYPNMKPQIEDMKTRSEFIYTSDFSKGNFYFLLANGRNHWWGNVRHYIYDALPYFFHEG